MWRCNSPSLVLQYSPEGVVVVYNNRTTSGATICAQRRKINVQGSCTLFFIWDLNSAEHARIFSTFELKTSWDDVESRGRNFVELRNETFPHREEPERDALYVSHKSWSVWLGKKWRAPGFAGLFKEAWRRGSVMKQVWSPAGTLKQFFIKSPMGLSRLKRLVFNEDTLVWIGVDQCALVIWWLVLRSIRLLSGSIFQFPEGKAIFLLGVQKRAEPKGLSYPALSIHFLITARDEDESKVRKRAFSVS